MNSRVKRQMAIAGGLVLLVAALVIGPLLYSHFTSKKNTAPGLATVEYQSFPVVATASGIVLNQNLINVSWPMAGQVAAVSVAAGNAVQQGQQLGKLDDTTQLAEVAAGQAAVSAADQAVATAESTGNAAAIAAAQSQLASANANLVRANADEARTVLTAPQSGTVLEVNVQVGQTVAAGTTGVPTVPGSSTSIIDPNQVTNPGGSKAAFVIGDPKNFEVVAQFSQSDATRLQAAQPATITFDALPGLTLPGKVSAVATAAVLVNGVPEYYAAVVPGGTDPRLRLGLTSTVSVTVAQANHVLAVPNQAIYSLDNQTHVDVWQHAARLATAVGTGMIGTTLTQITSGLTEGEQVVLTPSTTLPSASPS